MRRRVRAAAGVRQRGNILGLEAGVRAGGYPSRLAAQTYFNATLLYLSRVLVVHMSRCKLDGEA